MSKLTCASSKFVQKLLKVQKLKLSASTVSCLTNPPLACLTFYLTLLHLTSFYFTFFLCLLAFSFSLTYSLPNFAFCTFSSFWLFYFTYFACFACPAYSFICFMYLALDFAYFAYFAFLLR